MIDREAGDRPDRRLRIIDRTPDGAASQADPPLPGVVTADAAVAPAEDLPTVTILGAVDRPALTAALAAGSDHYVEWSGAAGTAAALAQLAGALCLSLSTRTAYRSLHGRMLGDTLAARGVVPPALAARVGRAVQEALANAIIHGNLALRMPAGADEEFERFHRAVAERLEGAEGARKITIAMSWTETELRIAVSDEGGGFEPPPSDAPVPDGAMSGRGLLVMRSSSDGVGFADGGRTTVLTYARSA